MTYSKEPAPAGGVSAEGAAVRLGAEAGQGGETHVYFRPAESGKTVTVSENRHNEDGAGCVLDVYLVLRNVRPGVRAAAAVALHEVDGDGAEHARGFHAMTSPAHHDPAPRDVALPRVRFVMPEDLRPADGPASCAGCRHFVVRTHSRYVDAGGL